MTGYNMKNVQCPVIEVSLFSVGHIRVHVSLPHIWGWRTTSFRNTVFIRLPDNGWSTKPSYPYRHYMFIRTKGHILYYYCVCPCQFSVHISLA
jgi:hypothetical protein